MKVNTTKLIILVLLTVISQATHMKRRRIKRLRVGVKKAEYSEEFKMLFWQRIISKEFTIDKEIAIGSFGIVFPIHDTNLVVKAMEDTGDDMEVWIEINMLIYYKKLSFSLPLCNFEMILKEQEMKGLLLYLPKAKGDLSTIRNEYTAFFEDNKITKKPTSFREKVSDLFGLNKAEENTTPEFEAMFHFITQMAVGLEEFHYKTNFIHRNIKENHFLLFDAPNPQSEQHLLGDRIANDKIVLSDFGLMTGVDHWKSGRIPGTPIYTPYFDFVKLNFEGEYEWKENYTTNRKSDVYSLGVTIFRLLNYNIFNGSISEIIDSIERKAAKNFAFENYKIFIKALKNNLKQQRNKFEIPEKQIKLEDYLLKHVFVLEEERLSSAHLVAFLKKINKEQYEDIVTNYDKIIKCERLSFH